MCMALLASCNDDNYEPGNGKYSNLTADLVDLHTSLSTRVDYATTDNNTILSFNPHMRVEWANQPDTIYRALLYYFKRDNTTNVDPYQAAPVNVLYPVDAAKVKTIVTDPVGLGSVWMAETGRYLNLQLNIKTASNTPSGDKQQVAMVLNKIEETDSGRKTYFYTFYHAQNGVPENYTTEVYFSMPTEKIAGGDIIHISINTDKGMVEREFVQR